MNGVRVATLGDIPLYVSPWFALLALYGGASTGSAATGAVWVACLIASLLVHELGHALVARRFRLHPQILLHGFGGLCGHDRAETDGHDALIVAAGPAAGLAFAGVSYGALMALQSAAPTLLTGPLAAALFWLVWMNLFWSLINLLPIWPLDGGLLFRLAAMRFTTPLKAERVTHGLSIGLLVAVMLAAFEYVGTFGMLIAAFIGWENVRVLRGERASGPVRSQHKFARELLRQATEAFDAGDMATCTRLCHQIRGESQLPASVLAPVWRMLGVATARQGNIAESVSYLRRARLDAEVAELWLSGLVQLDRQRDIDELLNSREWKRLGAKGQAIIDRVADAHAE